MDRWRSRASRIRVFMITWNDEEENTSSKHQKASLRSELSRSISVPCEHQTQEHGMMFGAGGFHWMQLNTTTLKIPTAMLCLRATTAAKQRREVTKGDNAQETHCSSSYLLQSGGCSLLGQTTPSAYIPSRWRPVCTLMAIIWMLRWTNHTLSTRVTIAPFFHLGRPANGWIASVQLAWSDSWISFDQAISLCSDHLLFQTDWR